MEEVAAVITVVDGWHGANRGMRILAIKSRIIVVIFFLAVGKQQTAECFRSKPNHEQKSWDGG